MTAKLVRLGEHPIEYALTSLDSLGCCPDHSIVVGDAAETLAWIMLRPDGRYRIRRVDGELAVNGERVDERVLRSGDAITLGGARFCFVMDAEPARTPDPPRRQRSAPAPIDPGWTVTQMSGRIVAFGEGLVVVRSHWWRRPRKTHLLVRDGANWRECGEVPSDIRGVWELGEGSLVAIGPGHFLLGRPGDLRAVPHAPLPAFHRVCGPSARCVYALSEVGLYHFDGDRWQAVDLAAQGVERDRGNGRVLWSDATCDPAGRCWIVGADQKHGTLATGIGAKWEAVGHSGIGALSHVARAADGTLFVVGFGMTAGLWPVGRASYRVAAGAEERQALAVDEDPRWPAYGGVWRSLDGYLAGAAWPVAFGCCELDCTRPLLVGVPHTGTSRELHLFLGGRWCVAPTPGGLSPERAFMAISPDGRLMFAAGSEIWTSGPLFER